jgi:hypothetical protein
MSCDEDLNMSAYEHAPDAKAAFARLLECAREFERVTGCPGDLYIDDIEAWYILGCPEVPPPHDYVERDGSGVCTRCDNYYPLDDAGLKRKICTGDPAMNTGRRYER